MPGHLAAGTSCHHSQNCSGACDWRKGAQPPQPPAAPQPLAERQGATLYILGIGCNFFFNSILIIFFSSLDGGGKWVNEYLIKVPSFHLGASVQFGALVARLVNSGS